MKLYQRKNMFDSFLEFDVQIYIRRTLKRRRMLFHHWPVWEAGNSKFKP